MREPLGSLSGRHFDVAVIGAGINGASAAQYLAAAGYSVLLVDKGDFAQGASSRSSRVLHCGLRYLAPGASMWEFVAKPKKFLVAARMARQAMQDRQDFVRSTPERAQASTFFYPMYRDGGYAPWQVRAAFKLLEALGPKEVPLGTRFIRPSEIPRTPLANMLRDRDRLLGVVAFQEYMFDWPERIVVDEALDAERMGAVVRNYTPVTDLKRDEQKDLWRVTLTEVETGESAMISAKVVLNMTGVWIDQVNGFASPRAARKIFGTKGVNIVVRLPPECRGHGLAGLSREMEPLYVRPWRDLHYIGPTETVYEGDPDDVRPDEEDIEFLLEEGNHVLPSLGLKHSDILYTWAGVRPLTYDPSYPKGKRSREIHDLGGDGMPNMFAVTAGPIMTHRSIGAELRELLMTRLPPSGSERKPDLRGRRFPAPGGNSPPLLADIPEATVQDLIESARHERVHSLVDLLFRRVNVGWSATMGQGVARQAAEAVADVLGWDRDRVEQEVAAYHDYLAKVHQARSEDTLQDA